MHLRNTRAYRRRHGRGFTLIELMTVVVIIAVLAAISVPLFVSRMRERRVQQASGEVASLVRAARTRALGRGAAVLVSFNGTNFDVREGIEGAPGLAARGRTGEASCSDLPAQSCTRTDWTNAAISRSVGGYTGTGYTTSVTVGASSATSFMLCFNPSGRSFIRTGSATTWSNFTTPVTVKLTGESGRERDVVVLPNGTARLAL